MNKISKSYDNCGLRHLKTVLNAINHGVMALCKKSRRNLMICSKNRKIENFDGAHNMCK